MAFHARCCATTEQPVLDRTPKVVISTIEIFHVFKTREQRQRGRLARPLTAVLKLLGDRSDNEPGYLEKCAARICVSISDMHGCMGASDSSNQRYCQRPNRSGIAGRGSNSDANGHRYHTHHSYQ